MNQTEAIKKAEDRLSLCIHISECSENKERDKRRRSAMREIERAIEHIADNVRFLQTHDYADNSLQAHELALTALKEKLEREKKTPNCRECKNIGKSWACDNCTYDRSVRNRTSYYEPKGENQ